tara:strand:+ start:4808 stop:5389 length:582 start_codon:yes stop_codon:yes gene_type:complete
MADVLDIQEVSRANPFATMDLDPVREWLRITHTDEDDALRTYMAAAERQASIWCHASFAQTTLKLTCHGHNTNANSQGDYEPIGLVRGPASSVTSVTDGTTTVTTGLVMDDRLPQRLYLPAGLQGNARQDITVQYVCGYASWAAMPGHVQHLLLLTLAQMYSQRNPVVVGTSVAEVPWTLAAAIAGCQREALP